MDACLEFAKSSETFEKGWRTRMFDHLVTRLANKRREDTRLFQAVQNKYYALRTLYIGFQQLMKNPNWGIDESNRMSSPDEVWAAEDQKEGDEKDAILKELSVYRKKRFHLYPQLDELFNLLPGETSNRPELPTSSSRIPSTFKSHTSQAESGNANPDDTEAGKRPADFDSGSQPASIRRRVQRKPESNFSGLSGLSLLSEA